MIATPAEPMGAKIARLRANRGLSAARLAERVGVTARTINYIESGERGVSIAVFARLADAFGLTMDALYNDPSSRLIAALDVFGPRPERARERQRRE